MAKTRSRKSSPHVDEHSVKELVLFTANDGDLYRQQVQPIIENLAKKHAKGEFDAPKAVKLMGYLADNGARKYAFEFGDPMPGVQFWSQYPMAKASIMFPPAVRQAAAGHLLEEYMEAIVEESARRRAVAKPKHAASPKSRRR